MLIRRICGGGWGRGWAWRRRGRFQPRSPYYFISRGLQVSPAECHMPAGVMEQESADLGESGLVSVSPMAAGIELLHELFLVL